MKKSILTLRNDIYYYQETPFDGIAFDVADGVVLSAEHYQGGIAVSPYQSVYLAEVSAVSSLPGIDAEWLDDEGDYFTINGQPFSGLAYSFGGDYCTEESLYDRGWESGYSISFRKSGELEGLTLSADGLSQEYHWDDQGQIDEYHIDSRPEFGFHFRRGDEELPGILRISGDYFRRVRSITTQARPPLFETSESLIPLRGARHQILDGDALDDQLLHALIDNGFFTETVRLRIYRTGLSTDAMSRLRYLPGLKRLSFDDN